MNDSFILREDIIFTCAVYFYYLLLYYLGQFKMTLKQRELVNPQDTLLPTVLCPASLARLLCCPGASCLRSYPGGNSSC